MRYIISLILVFGVAFSATSQQINPVPDYIFRNQMSVGRNAATDTAAYLSVGPRFGAVKGFMPPMVVDTNAVTGVKRNGLLIFSVQLNNFAYWDSTTSRFRKITAEAVVDSVLFATRAWRQKGIDSVNANVALKVNISDTATMLGAYLRKGDTSSMLTPYVRIAGFGLTKATQTLSVDSALMATRARVQKGIDSVASVRIGGSGTQGVFPIFTGTTTIGNTPFRYNGSNIYTIARTTGSQNDFILKDSINSNGNPHSKITFINNIGNESSIGQSGSATGDFGGMTLEVSNRPIRLRTNGNTRLLATSAGRVLVGTETESTYTLDVNGSLRSTSALFTGTTEVGSGATFKVTGTNSSFDVIGGYVGSGELPSGTLFTSNGTASNYSFIINGISGTAGQKAVFAAFNGSAWRSVIEWENVSIGSEPRIALVRNAGNVVVGASGAGSYKVDITGSLRSTTDAYFATSSGNVGIGNTSASEKLHVTGRIRATTIDSSASPINMLWADNTGVIRKTAVPAGGATDSATFATRARVQKAVDSINSNNASGTGISGYMTRWSGTKTLDTSQIFQQADRIGIGTASPDTRLSVAGDGTGIIRIGPGVGGNTAAIGLNGTITSTTYSVLGEGDDLFLNRPSGGKINFRNDNVSQMTLTNSGRLLIGTDTEGTYKLDVKGSVNFESNIRLTSANAAFGLEASEGVAFQIIDRSQNERIAIFDTTHKIWFGKLGNVNGSSATMRIDGVAREAYVGDDVSTFDDGAFPFQVKGVSYASGGFHTGAPTGGTAATWKLGSRVASSVALDATQYIEVDIGGTLYYLATVSFLQPKP